MSLPRLLSKRNAQSRYSSSGDASLIAACLKGETDAWDALVRRYEGLIFSIPIRLGLSQTDAEDVFQDVCVLLLDHLEDLRHTERLAGWLAVTTRREVWRWQKRRGALPVSGTAEWEMEAAIPLGAEPNTTLDKEIIEAVERHLVRQGLERLNERCRILLTLLYCTDPPVSYAEVAERLGLPVGSIGPTRARCLNGLHKELDALGF